MNQSTIELLSRQNIEDYDCDSGKNFALYIGFNTNSYTAGVGMNLETLKQQSSPCSINGKRCWHSFNPTLMRLKRLGSRDSCTV